MIRSVRTLRCRLAASMVSQPDLGVASLTFSVEWSVMPYLQRNPSGDVIALFLAAPEPDTEWLTIDHPDILAFLANSDDRGEAAIPFEVLATLDRAMIRVLEDLVDVLVDKHVIALSDLPEQARTKVIARKELRSTLPFTANPRTDNAAGGDDIV